jgi:hypothetical protein
MLFPSICVKGDLMHTSDIDSSWKIIREILLLFLGVCSAGSNVEVVFISA